VALTSRPIPCRIALIAAITACALGTVHAAPGSTKLNARPAVGVQFHCTWRQSEATRSAIAEKLSAAGVRHVRIDLGWSSFQPLGPRRIDPWYRGLADHCVNLARAQGMEVLATIMWTPDWANRGRGPTVPPRRVRNFARFMRWAARHFRGRVAAWEIWNEPDGTNFWQGTPARYARLLRAAYPAIKRGDPNAKVVFAGNSDNSPQWLAAAYTGGAKGAFDVMAAHPYRSDQSPDAGGDEAWLLMHASQLHAVMARHGDGAKPIWFTEFGWSVHANRPDLPPWQRGVTAEEQAAYLTSAVGLIGARYPFVEKAFWYKDAARPGEDDVQSGYGLLKADLAPRPAYWALKALLVG
jgi:hypothetical protein